MKNKWLPSLVACLLANVSPHILLAQPMQYENQVIERIEIEVENLPEGIDFDLNAVRSRMHTRSGDFFSQTEFDQDLKRLVQDFDRVEPEIENINGKLQITVKVWPKPTIRIIQWNGFDRIDVATLRKELGVQPFSVYDRYAFNRAFHKIKTLYIKKGFFEAELDYSICHDPETNEVDITITIVEGRAGKIKDIVFEGFCPDEESDLLDEILTKEYCLFTSWFTNEGLYNEEMVLQDQYTILNYLHNKGYADAKVQINVTEADQCDRIIITIQAEKGEIYRFGPVGIFGANVFCDEDILRQLSFAPGMPYSPEKIRKTISNITNLYGRRGYIDAAVDYEPSLECDELKYTVTLRIDEGEQFRVGMIKVFGNCATQTKVLLHENLLVPGEIFNIEKLQKTEEKLKNIGFFKNVNVYAVRSDGPLGLGGCYRDVHIEVEETGTGNFSLFMGYSTVETIFGGLTVTEKNFNIAGLTRFWNEGCETLRGAGEYAHLNITIGARNRAYGISWVKPFWNDTPWAVGFDLQNSSNRYISDDYVINSWGYNLHATYPINQFVRFGWHLRLKDTQIEVNHNAPEQLKHDAKNAGGLSATGVTFTYDSTDNPMRPTEGFKSRVEFEYAGLGGTHNFLSAAYLNTYYVPLTKKGVLSYRADFRFIQPFPLNSSSEHSIPIDERLFLGGENAIRGYRAYKIGPRYGEHSDDPKGGLSLELYSVEYAHRYNNRVEAFLFFDAGHLSENTWEFAVPRVSLGFGARIKILDSTPPLTIGMGYPVNAENNSEVKRFFLNVGGKF